MLLAVSRDAESLEEAVAEGRENGKVWRLVGAEEVGSGTELWREARKREGALWAFIHHFSI